MSEKVYIDSFIHRESVTLRDSSPEFGSDYTKLHDIINAQNERIAALEGQVKTLWDASSKTFGGQPV